MCRDSGGTYRSLAGMSGNAPTVCHPKTRLIASPSATVHRVNPSPDTGGRSQQGRRTVELPRELVRAFRETSRATGGPPGAALVYSWLMDGVQRARAGLPLPPAASAPPPQGNEVSVLWTQTPEEFSRWREELRAAGSSVRAVLAHRIQRYTETGGDPLAGGESRGEGHLPLAS